MYLEDYKAKISNMTLEELNLELNSLKANYNIDHYDHYRILFLANELDKRHVNTTKKEEFYY